LSRYVDICDPVRLSSDIAKVEKVDPPEKQSSLVEHYRLPTLRTGDTSNNRLSKLFQKVQSPPCASDTQSIHIHNSYEYFLEVDRPLPVDPELDSQVIVGQIPSNSKEISKS
jgi:hypothetical protein